jgi:hypothetical protein
MAEKTNEKHNKETRKEEEHTSSGVIDPVQNENGKKKLTVMRRDTNEKRVKHMNVLGREDWSFFALVERVFDI